MTILASWHIYCDDPNHGDEDQWYAGEHRTRKEAQTAMKARGWTKKGRKDICPDCSEEQKEKQ